MREVWTDARLDDLIAKVDAGFARVDAEVRELRSEMNRSFEALQRNIWIGGLAIVAAVIGAGALT